MRACKFFKRPFSIYHMKNWRPWERKKIIERDKMQKYSISNWTTHKVLLKFTSSKFYGSITKREKYLQLIFNFVERVSSLNDFFNSGWTHRFARSLIGVALCDAPQLCLSLWGEVQSGVEFLPLYISIFARFFYDFHIIAVHSWIGCSTLEFSSPVLPLYFCVGPFKNI